MYLLIADDRARRLHRSGMLARFSIAPVADRIREQIGMRVLTSLGTAVEKLMRIFSQ